MLTIEQIDHIATLARIRLTDQEREQYRAELSSILDYIAQLEEVDTQGIEPLFQVTGLVNSFRTDHVPDVSESQRLSDRALITQAPEHVVAPQGGEFVRVRSVLRAK